LLLQKKKKKSGWEEWIEGFIARPLMIVIPAHQIVNGIAWKVKQNNSQLNPVTHRIIKTLVYSCHPEQAMTRLALW
jgi:hypothetical protein